MRKTLTALAAIVSLLAIAPPAGADSGGGIFYQSAAGTTGNQCAWWQGIVTYTTPAPTIQGETRTSIGGSANCSSILYFPTGWIVASMELQIHNGTAWVRTNHPEAFQTQTNVSSPRIAYDIHQWKCLRPGWYRVLTGHRVLMNGAERTAVWASASIEVNTNLCGYYSN